MARAELAGAEQDLEHALQAVPSAARAEKRIISAALVAAMEKRSAAKGRLESALAAAGQIS